MLPNAENKELIFDLSFVTLTKIKANFAEPSRVILSFQSKLVSLVCYVTFVHSCLMYLNYIGVF